MPIWLSIVASVIGIIGTIGGILGLTAYFGERAKHKANLRNKKEDKEREDLENMRHEKYVKELRSIIKEEMEPILKNIEDIKFETDKNHKATVDGLRATMKELRDHYMLQGFADVGDKATWKELYKDYGNMGGNNFSDWVDGWKKDVEDLPLKKTSPKNTKKVLVEKKEK